LKGSNRGFFEKLLIRNIKASLDGIACNLRVSRARYEVTDFDGINEHIIVNRLKLVSGISSISVALRCESNLDNIAKAVITLAPTVGSFRMSINRADKRFGLSSHETACRLGECVLESNPELKVDLHNPGVNINVDIREDKFAYVYSEAIKGAGGMPVGSASKGLLLLSGGLDSPVAGYLMSKRGMPIEALHFHSYPYTSEMAQAKVEELAKTLSRYTGGDIKLTSISVTHIQEAIHKHCDPDYMICLLRRAMIRLASEHAVRTNCKCLITGESLGQVASQTIESITATNEVAGVPILRPLIAFDKNDIIDIAKMIGTYEISIRPYEDCCTVFLPKHPVIKPKLDRVLKEEAKLSIDSLSIDKHNTKD